MAFLSLAHADKVLLEVPAMESCGYYDAKVMLPEEIPNPFPNTLFTVHALHSAQVAGITTGRRDDTLLVLYRLPNGLPTAPFWGITLPLL